MVPGPNGAALPIRPSPPEPESIEIRKARLEDLSALPGIERSAAEAFRRSSQPGIADDDVAPMEAYLPLAAQGLVWVAEDGGRLVGFASSEIFEGELHLWELAVRLEAQGHGAGRALIAAVAKQARDLDLPVTLTTFRDIPWNAPFYARCGFVELRPAEFSPLLNLVFERQARLGLKVASRCAMRLKPSALPPPDRPGDRASSAASRSPR